MLEYIIKTSTYMKARRDEAKHMEAQTLRVLGQHQHAVQVRRSATPELLTL